MVTRGGGSSSRVWTGVFVYKRAGRRLNIHIHVWIPFHTLSRLRSAWIVRISATSPGSETGPVTRPSSSDTTSTPSTAAAAAAAEAWPVAGLGQASSARSRQEATRALSVGALERKAPAGDASPVAQGVNLRGSGRSWRSAG